jgi:hypothetical protein
LVVLSMAFSFGCEGLLAKVDSLEMH